MGSAKRYSKNPASSFVSSFSISIFSSIHFLPKNMYSLCSNQSRTEEPAKAGTCARDRRALQQLALNVHVKH